MALNLPTFYKRLGSSIVFVAVMLTGLLWNEMSFLSLACIINYVCLNEYFLLIQKIDPNHYHPKWLAVFIHIISFVIIFLFSVRPGVDLAIVFWYFLGILPVLPAVLLLVSTLSEKTSFMAAVQSIGGLFYITLPMLLLVLMHNVNFIIPLALILMIWSNDTLAYLVGSFIGKNSFSPISPNKTWEGVVGGAILTIIGAGLYGYFSHKFRMVDWMALAFCATVAGTLGDLLESKLKRMADVKDSGNLMPGHGGALDRFDSLLVAVPFAFVYVSYFMR